MRNVTEAAASISAKLSVMSEKANNINQVLTTITKVADQTNLLSLNAAIEAEKAGEVRRGFAATQLTEASHQTVLSLRQSTDAIGGLNEVAHDLRRLALQARINDSPHRRTSPGSHGICQDRPRPCPTEAVREELDHVM